MTDLYTDGKYVHLNIYNHQFCINVDQVQDVLHTPSLTNVPLSLKHICGLMNLRGRIVTAIDVGVKLGLPAVFTKENKGMSVIVELEGELYGLIFSEVGEVLTFNKNQIDTNSNTIDSRWREFSSGICLQDQQIIVILDVNSLMHLT